MEEQPCKVTVLLQHPFSEENKDQLLSGNTTQFLVALLYCKDSQHKFQANLDVSDSREEHSQAELMKPSKLSLGPGSAALNLSEE